MFLYRKTNHILLLSLFCLLISNIALTTSASAQSCPIIMQKPWDVEVNEAYKIRTKHPVSGASNRPHKGVDLNRPGSGDCNEPVALSSNCKDVSYSYIKGYGNTLKRDCGNGVTELYAHLAGYKPGSINIGTTGGSTGCHLHYEVAIDNETVDPLCLWGQDPNTYLNAEEKASTGGVSCPAGLKGAGNLSNPDLCDAQNRELLKQDGKDKLNGQNTASHDTVGSNPQTEDTTTPSTPGGGGNDGDDGTGGVYIPGDAPPYVASDVPTEDDPPPPEEEEPEEPEPEEPYDPVAAKPRCTNSTCITQDHIDNAKHKRVKEDKAKSHMEYMTADGKCKDPSQTGMTLFRQQVGKIRKYPDGVCTNKGCVYENKTNGGKGKCK